MAIERISSLDDPRIDSYRRLKDRELARDGQRFIAEGEFVVQRLLASDCPVESVLLAERRAEEIAPLAPLGVPVYVIGNEQIHQIIGYRFHSGVIACGRRKPWASLDVIAEDRSKPLTLVICPEIANAENLGGLIRLAAAFGVDAMVLGPKSVDPYWRQSVRVSMGTVFKLPMVRWEDFESGLSQCLEKHGIELWATVLDADAEPLANIKPARRVGILFGNEAQGLQSAVVDRCQRRVMIPMKLGTDSLNVAVSAGIFLYVLAGHRDKMI
jgi:tRNA G18 (ribose-2'-O)-methylase SpoU